MLFLVLITIPFAAVNTPAPVEARRAA
jgi:hypothetical protein